LCNAQFFLDDSRIITILNKTANHSIEPDPIKGDDHTMPFAAQMSKQIVSIQKTFLNNVFDTQALWQDQTERAAQAILGQAHWMPDASRQLWDCWTADLKTGQATLKSMLNAQFEMIDGILTQQDAPS